jgi:hypothetical protein
MADENLEQKRPEEESKKDTVRINLPPGLTGRGAPGTGGAPPPSVKPKPAGPPGSPEDEAKRETSVMGRPAEVPRPKKDTSRVQVVAAKPITADAARPAIKIRREDEVPAAPESAGPAAAAPAGRGAKPVSAGAGAPSGAEAGLNIFAIVVSLAVAGYLAYIAFG